MTMTGDWVGVSVRARAMTRRRCGREGARLLGASGSLAAAMQTLAQSPYGHDLGPGQRLDMAQRAVVATFAWNVRVLAGWAPREGVAVLRALMACLEVANTVDHLDAMAGEQAPDAYQLGSLDTAWSRLRETSTVAELRNVLVASPWGDPGGDSPRAIGLAMRAVAADRVVAAVPEAGGWAAGAVALLLARELAADRGPVPEGCRAASARVVGWQAASTTRLPDLVAAVPRDARWAVTGVQTSVDLWRAELRWWRRVEQDGLAMARRNTPGRPVLVGTVALLAADAWRVRAALELAAHGGSPAEDANALA